MYSSVAEGGGRGVRVRVRVRVRVGGVRVVLGLDLHCCIGFVGSEESYRLGLGFGLGLGHRE